MTNLNKVYSCLSHKTLVDFMFIVNILFAMLYKRKHNKKDFGLFIINKLKWMLSMINFFIHNKTCLHFIFSYIFTEVFRYNDRMNNNKQHMTKKAI